ncbi:hypothetical protein QN416_07505 [Glaciimonas sp. Cout2]|uniref:hypothetical protein n=2 Tax=unclassified Glaciimonas TaxID=2644401 RepID=UPI002B22B67E|nr:hypothetical protein [Glaciimonas sp. Cout2]MEB0011469.1 hypothetical protein [Glaciimonas sp. Cout2]
MKNIKILKYIQYLFFLLSFILLILSIVLIEIGVIKPISLSYKNVFNYLLFIFENFSWELNNVAMYVILEIGCLFIFFGIALYIAVKILPMQLSESQREKIIISPWESFNEIIFKKILFGSVGKLSNGMFDMRKPKLFILADLYLYHFKIVKKHFGLVLIFIILFIFPILSGMEYKSLVYLLAMNFVYMNALFLFILEINVAIYCMYIGSKNHGRS